MTSFQTMQDMVVVHRTGMSDMMISRLVELANWSSGLACLVAVQIEASGREAYYRVR
jgi:hypothetical protein